MRQFNVGDTVKAPNGKIGTIKGFQSGNRSMALVWFTSDGTETAVISVASLIKS